MSLRWVAVAVAALACVRPADGQSPDTLAGKYHVRGFYQDEEMPPWQAALLVRDSTLEGAKGTQVRYRSRLVGGKWLFDYVAVWTSTGTMRARLLGDGRAGKSMCELSYAAGTIEGISDQGPLTSKAASGAVIPDFAIGGYLSTLNANAGDTVRVTIARCLPQFGAAGITLVPFVGVVRATTYASTSGAVAEAAWEIKGGTEYPAEALIRRRDRMLLSLRIPQGTDAYSIDTLAP